MDSGITEAYLKDLDPNRLSKFGHMGREGEGDWGITFKCSVFKCYTYTNNLGMSYSKKDEPYYMTLRSPDIDRVYRAVIDLIKLYGGKAEEELY